MNNDQIRWRIEGDVPAEVVMDFQRFMNEEALKINKIIHKDLNKWLKPLPEGYHRYFRVDVSTG